MGTQPEANDFKPAATSLPRILALPVPDRFLILDGMHSHEVLRESFQKTNPKEVAAELGLSLSMIYKWAEPPGEASGAVNPLDRVAQLIRLTEDTRLLQWICQQGGGFFIENPKTTNSHPDFLIPATNEILQEFADLLAVIATAAGDNHISSQEAKTIRARWEELKSVTECFVHCCEGGNFNDMKVVAREREAAMGKNTHPPGGKS